jgi:hypothetical protein
MIGSNEEQPEKEQDEEEVYSVLISRKNIEGEGAWRR